MKLQQIQGGQQIEFVGNEPQPNLQESTPATPVTTRFFFQEQMNQESKFAGLPESLHFR
jgi:hypothetical protein